MYKITRIRGLANKYVLMFYKGFNLRTKFKYFIQINNLYYTFKNKKYKEIKDIYSLRIKWRKIKNDFGDTFLEVQLIKNGSWMDNEILDMAGQLKALLNCELLLKENQNDKVVYIFLYDYKREYYDLSAPVFEKASDCIDLNKYYKWDFNKDAHILITGNTGSGKSYMLYSILHKAMSLTNKKNIYICDGKFDELKKIAIEEYELLNVAKNMDEIETYIRMVNQEMEKRYLDGLNEENKARPIFLIIDEYIAVKVNSDNSKELEKIIKNITLKGRSANIHVVVGLQRARSGDIDLAIRDNLTLKLGLGDLSSENFEMTFDEKKTANELTKRNAGEGYIKSNGKSISLFYAPYMVK